MNNNITQINQGTFYIFSTEAVDNSVENLCFKVKSRYASVPSIKLIIF